MLNKIYNASIKLKENNRYEYFFTAFIFIFIFILSYHINTYYYSLGLYQQINIAFDFDQAWFVDTISRSSDSWIYRNSSESSPLLIKHPLIYTYKPISEILQLLGYKPDYSAILVVLIFTSLTPVMFYYTLKLCYIPLTNRIIFTLIYVLTSTFIINSIVIDSYSIAQFWMLLSVTLFIKSNNNSKKIYVWEKAIVYTFLVGTTSYLVIFAIICELITISNKSKKTTKKILLNYATTMTIKFSITFFIFLSIIYRDIFIELISNPIPILKQTLWSVARPGEKEGIGKVLETFLFYSLISPDTSNIRIGEKLTMIDYRHINYSYSGYLCIALITIGYAMALKKINKPIVILSILWVIINLIFHLEYQDRGSLFIYSGHILPTILLLLSIGITSLKKYSQVYGITLIILFTLENSDISKDINNTLKLNNIKYHQVE